ncbi:hypothetical protein HYPSUDRAFT_90221, partial [Hypholoma sublateritium FD-334 SS-4]
MRPATATRSCIAIPNNICVQAMARDRFLHAISRALWASLLIGFNCPTLDPVHRRSWLNGIDLIPPWLTRSGTQKLNITIQCSRLKYLCFPPEMKALFELIKSHASRWVTLNLKMPGHFCMEFFRDTYLDAPHLTHLQLHEVETYYPHPRPHVMFA